MRFNSYFEQDFLANERINLSNVICSEENMPFLKVFNAYMINACSKKTASFLR